MKFLTGIVLGSLSLVVLSSRAERISRGQLQLENIPEIPPEVSARCDQYENVRSANLLSWHPQGDGILIRTRFAETAQVHLVARPGGARWQLTFFQEPVGSASYSPDPRLGGFALTRDVGGAEFDQIYWMDTESGRSSLLSDGSSVNRAVTWSNRGDCFAYVSTRRNGRDFDLYVASMPDGGTSRLVLEREGLWVPGDWSPDDSRVIILQYVSVAECHVQILDLADGRTSDFNPQPPGAPTIAYRDAVWSAEGRGIFFISDQDSEFQRLRYWDLETNRQEVLTPDINWDVEALAISPSRSDLAFSVNEGGRSSLYLLDAETREIRRVENLAIGVVSGLQFSPEGRMLGFTMSTAGTSADVFSLDLKSGAIEQWTRSELGGLDPKQFAVPELVEYPTFDRVAPEGPLRRIPAWIYRPRAASPAHPAPVLILIHGGPEGQSRPSFSASIQLYVNELGFAVAAPNVRGSTGYGKSYVGLDNGRKREDSVRDIGALLDWIGTRPELDPGRVVVMGGSYGGYMALACMTHFNDRLAAGIDVVGISNFVTFLTNTQDYRRDLRRVEYGDERDPEMREFLLRISPISNIGNVTKPMLVVQGFNDPRVPASESEQLLAALKRNGAEPWFILGLNEGHGFRKKENIDVQRDVTFLFLQTVLAAP